MRTVICVCRAVTSVATCKMHHTTDSSVCVLQGPTIRRRRHSIMDYPDYILLRIRLCIIPGPAGAPRADHVPTPSGPCSMTSGSTHAHRLGLLRREDEAEVLGRLLVTRLKQRLPHLLQERRAAPVLCEQCRQRMEYE